MLRGICRSVDLSLSDVTSLRWRPQPGKFVLRGSQGRKAKIAVEFDNFEKDEQLEIIRYMRATIPDGLQQNWPMFCHRVAIRLRDYADDRQPGPAEVRLTRRHFDKLALASFVVSSPICIVVWWTTGDPVCLLAAPIASLLLLMFRFTIPKAGMISPRMFANPDESRFLGMMGLMAAAAFAWFVLRARIDLITLADAIFFGVFFATMLTFAYFEDRRKGRQRKVDMLGSVRQWDAGETVAQLIISPPEVSLEP